MFQLNFFLYVYTICLNILVCSDLQSLAKMQRDHETTGRYKMVRYRISKNFHPRKNFAEKMNYYENVFES